MINPFNLPPQYAWLDRSDDGRQYAKFVDGLRSAAVKFGTDVDFYDVPLQIKTDVPLADANAVSSEYLSEPGLHKVVLDIDFDAMLVPSATNGHHHLYIDKLMTWDQYQALLKALATAGIIEGGYARGSIASGASWVRTPWSRQ